MSRVDGEECVREQHAEVDQVAILLNQVPKHVP
jgi:hypothetical protein